MDRSTAGLGISFCGQRRAADATCAELAPGGSALMSDLATIGSGPRAEVGDHDVRFYLDQRPLVSAVVEHLTAGMRAGGAGLLITTPWHATDILDGLAAKGFAVHDALAQGDLIVADAHETLDRFLIEGACDAERFRAVVGERIGSALARHPSVYAFAEMVDVLCARSQHLAMLELEGMWNEIVASLPVHLLCGYRLDRFARGRDAKTFASICDVHREVHPAEDRPIGDAGAQRRVLAELEQQALALRGEIDDRRRVERDLRHLRDEHVQATAAAASLTAVNAELKHFAAVCAHDLREPLRMVSRFLELFDRRYAAGLEPEARSFIGFALDGARRMADLIDGLLRYAAGEVGLQHEPVDLDAVLDEILRLLAAPIAEANAAVHRQRLPVVRGDRSALARLLQNLLGNALKFRSERPLAVAIAVARVPGAWRISVSDNGIGIEPADRERVFREFERLGPAGRGSGAGLGLPICRRIVEKHGGRIWVDGAPGGGTAVRFTLPADPADAPIGG
jgi:signal transduction histidine kinase